MDTRSAGVAPFHCLEPPPADCRASAMRSQVFLTQFIRHLYQ